MASTSRIRAVTELVGALSIVLSLVFVGMELRQSSVVARAELSAESSQIFREILDAQQSPQFASTFLKAQLSPGELTASERIQVRAFLTRVLHLFEKEKYNYDRGIFDTWEEYIYFLAPLYFAEGYGRAFFEVLRAGADSSPIIETIGLALDNPEAVSLVSSIERRTPQLIADTDQ